jgi:hypothetical protein
VTLVACITILGTTIGLALSTLATPAAAGPTTRYVAPSGAGGSGCANPTSPCSSVSAAVQASQPGDIIEVAGTIEDHVIIDSIQSPWYNPLTIEQWSGQAPAVVDGGGSGYVFSIGVDSGGVQAGANLNGLTITGGDASNGGADFGSGSGVDNENGTVVLTDDTVSDNTVEAGGGGAGILNDFGTMTVVDSTISGNAASGVPPAGINDSAPGAGAGIENYDGTLSITASTLTGNTTSTEGGGLFNDGGGTVDVTASTIADNTSLGNPGGGVSNAGGTVTLGDTIVADNQAPVSSPNCGGTLKSVGFNLTDDATGAACGMTQASDVVNTEPDLGSLADNGGPTQTMLPSSNSPAAGVVPDPTSVNDTSVCGNGALDQRGTARPSAGSTSCTIGAVEVARTLVAPTITSADDTTFSQLTPGSFTVTTTGYPTPALTEVGALPNGLTFADNGNGTATISGMPALGSEATYSVTITANNGVAPNASQTFTLTVPAAPLKYVSSSGNDLNNSCGNPADPCATVSHAAASSGPGVIVEVAGTINDNVEVVAPQSPSTGPLVVTQWPGHAPAVIDGQGQGSVFTVAESSPGGGLNLDHITVTDGDASDGGAAFLSGSGIDNEYGVVTLTDVTVSDNTVEAGGTGAGILNDFGQMTIIDSTISGNAASGSPPAGVNNSAPGAGAGIANYSGALSITASTLTGNTTSTEGGGLFNDGGGTVDVTATTIADNTSLGNAGGGVFNAGGTVTLGDTIVAGNQAPVSSPNCGGTLTSAGFNLTDDSTGSACGMTQASDVVNADSALGSLADNGGPTQTMLPASNSPAVGAVPDPTVLNGMPVCGAGAFDQQGSPRPQAGSHACTIGAVEGPLKTQTVTFTSSASNPVVGGTYTPSANASSGAAVVFSIDPATSPANACTINPTTPTVTFTHVGTCQIDATAPALGGFASATASQSIAVARGASAVAVTSTPSAPTFGQPASFDAVVSSPGAAAGSPIPTGTVTFTVDGTPIGTAITIGPSGGATSPPVPGLAPGTHTVVATYSGDSNYTGSPSAPLTITIGCASTIKGSSGSITVSGSTCVQGGTIKGGINVGAGASVALTNATVDGPVNIQGSGTVTICGSTLSGPVSISGAGGALTFGDAGLGCAADQLSGPLTVSNSTGPLTIAGTHFSGPVAVTGTTGTISMSDATVDGPLQLATNSGGITLTGSTIKGPLTVSQNTNGAVVISGNTVAGPVSVNANAGSVAPVVAANTVSGSLGCTANTPPPVDGGVSNIVSGKATAQCAGLA